METIWREQMVKGYRNDPIYQLAQDSNNTSRGSKMQHYRIGNGLLYGTTRGGKECLYIPKGHRINGETLRELMISKIHNKGHHSANRNLRYAFKYIYWPEMRKDFRDFVRQCKPYLANKERNPLPDGDAQTLSLLSEIFLSYAIDFMGTFTKQKGHDSVLVVVDRAVGFSWLIPTSVTATAVQTTELLRHHNFTPHGVPISIVSDADPRFTSKFWKQTLNTMGIEHIMAAPDHHQTNGWAERKIRELKIALQNVINLRQTNWLILLPEVTAYSNASHSEVINMSPYKAVYRQEYPLLDTYRVYPSAVPASNHYYNRHQEIRNAAYQALKLARARFMRLVAKRRKDFELVEGGGMRMIFRDQFATESGRSRKLQLRWRGPFVVVEYDKHTQNYTVSMDSRIYRCQRGVFHCSVVKPCHSNDDDRFPGRAQAKPAPILIDDEKEWEVANILD